MPRLKSTEIELLADFMKVTEPLAKGLDILPGEKNCFLGTEL